MTTNLHHSNSSWPQYISDCCDGESCLWYLLNTKWSTIGCGLWKRRRPIFRNLNHNPCFILQITLRHKYMGIEIEEYYYIRKCEISIWNALPMATPLYHLIWFWPRSINDRRDGQSWMSCSFNTASVFGKSHVFAHVRHLKKNESCFKWPNSRRF